MYAILKYCNGTGTIWTLARPLYGFKTPPTFWQNYFAEQKENIGCKHCETEPNLDYWEHGNAYTHVLVYVDDIMVTGSGPDALLISLHNVYYSNKHTNSNQM